MNPKVSELSAGSHPHRVRKEVRNKIAGFRRDRRGGGSALSACVCVVRQRGVGRLRSERQEGRRENEIAHGSSRWKRDKPARDAGRARRSEEHRPGVNGGAGEERRERRWRLRDRRRALVGIKGRSTQARLATERLRAATLSLVRRNPVQIYVQLPCQQCLKSPVRARAALVGIRSDR